jgi:fluoride ion exporter CrcB/FEX
MTETETEHWTSAWREPLDSVLYLSLFGVLGTLLRGGLVQQFSCYSNNTPQGTTCNSLDDGALFVTLAPNMLGCFFVGLFATPVAAGLAVEGQTTQSQLACLRPEHRLQRLSSLHLGLRVGFCGSLTTWASWNQTMVERIVHGDWARGLIGYVVGAELAAASLMLGFHAVHACHHSAVPATVRDSEDSVLGDDGVDVAIREPPPPPCSTPAPRPADDPHGAWKIEDKLCLALLLACLAGCIATVVAAPAASSRSICLAALFGPFGVVARWYLAKLNARTAWLPIGTLAANTLACAFDASVASAFVADKLGRGQYWGSLLSTALQSGIGGGLSTVSTVAAEASLLMQRGSRHRGYMYLGITGALGFGTAAVIYGPATH